MLSFPFPPTEHLFNYLTLLSFLTSELFFNFFFRTFYSRLIKRFYHAPFTYRSFICFFLHSAHYQAKQRTSWWRGYWFKYATCFSLCGWILSSILDIMFFICPTIINGLLNVINSSIFIPLIVVYFLSMFGAFIAIL